MSKQREIVCSSKERLLVMDLNLKKMQKHVKNVQKLWWIWKTCQDRPLIKQRKVTWLNLKKMSKQRKLTWLNLKKDKNMSRSTTESKKTVQTKNAYMYWIWKKEKKTCQDQQLNLKNCPNKESLHLLNLKKRQKKICQEWDLNPCPFGPVPETGALDQLGHLDICWMMKNMF
jgi:hypothetical protein